MHYLLGRFQLLIGRLQLLVDRLVFLGHRLHVFDLAFQLVAGCLMADLQSAQFLLERLHVARGVRRRLAVARRLASRPACAERHHNQRGGLARLDDRLDEEVDQPFSPRFDPQILLLDHPARREGALHGVAHLRPQDNKLNIIGWNGPKAAVEAIKDAAKSFKKNNK